MKKVGFGGGCHWCTEAVFSLLKGVVKVEQGFVNAKEESTFSEAIVLAYDPKIIALRSLIEIHLSTHKSTSEHSMRSKYRSAIYLFDTVDYEKAEVILERLKVEFDASFITKVLSYKGFEPSLEQFHNYYYSDTEKPFCTTYIAPKLSFLLKRYRRFTNAEKIESSIVPLKYSK